ncbi:MAG: uracil-DNA glycosylase [Syntrophaceae bacterium]|nr:uracil-DNA glycosylase [Syntrophaceae bacterium]
MNGRRRQERKVSCFECRHFFITHEPAWPYGCKAMGFKSREMPSDAVLRNSGEPCLCREPRPSGPPRERG